MEIAFCKLCGVAITAPCPAYFRLARGLDASGRWSSLASKSRSDKSLEVKCETLGVSIDSWFLERIESAKEETVPDLLNSLPRMALFHAMCAKWIDTAFRSRSVHLEKLAAFVGPNPKWTGDHLKCPDDASIQERQEHWWRHFEPVYPASRLDDPLWMDNLMKEVRRAIGWDKDGDNETDEMISGQSVSAAADFFMEEGRLAQFYLGSYVGSLAMVPAPLVAPASSGDFDPEESTVPKAGLGLHNPLTVPEWMLEKILRFLPVGVTGAMTLFSSSRSWYLHGRDYGWMRLCCRDGFARVPIEPLGQSVDEFLRKGIDWKRLYFCDESRNARRVAKNLAWLLDHAA